MIDTTCDSYQDIMNFVLWITYLRGLHIISATFLTIIFSAVDSDVRQIGTHPPLKAAMHSIQLNLKSNTYVCIRAMTKQI